MYGFLLLSYSNFFRKAHRFEIFAFKNIVMLKTRLGVLKVIKNVTIR